jgi:hypothetical protein
MIVEATPMTDEDVGKHQTHTGLQRVRITWGCAINMRSCSRHDVYSVIREVVGISGSCGIPVMDFLPQHSKGVYTTIALKINAPAVATIATTWPTEFNTKFSAHGHTTVATFTALHIYFCDVEEHPFVADVGYNFENKI